MKLIAKKSLGQHFLNSPAALRAIADAGKIQRGETVLEIGPGTGVLTRALLEAGARVIAVEKDRRAFDMLNQDFFTEIKSGALDVIEGDILDQKIISGIEKKHPEMRRSYAVIANIPYYITGAILQKFLEEEPRPDRMVLLVQKEVAERAVSRDGKESILSISVKAFGVPRIAGKVPRGAFTPAPTVDSAILSIDNISAGRFDEKKLDIGAFFKIVRAGFAHKRKFLKRNLEIVAKKPTIDSAWLQLGLPETIRAEEIQADQWINLAEKLAGR